MAPKVNAADLWKGFTKDKIVHFQGQLIRPCQMSRTSGIQAEETCTDTVPDSIQTFNMICVQYYQIICTWFWSWSSILLLYSQKARTSLWLLASRLISRRSEMLDRVKQMFSFLWLLANKPTQWRSDVGETLKRRILSRFTSFCSPGEENLEKQQPKRRIPVDRVCEQLRCQWVKIQKRTGQIVNYKVVMLLGLLAAQALLVYHVHKSRASSKVRECQGERHLPHHHIPSVWYYEHIHYYPRPQLRILTAEDGAPPIQSQLPVNPREITIATHTTMDRLPAVEMTAFRWSGPMVLVVLVRVQSEIQPTYAKLEDLHSRVEAEGRCRLHIKIVREEVFKNDAQALRALYPVNSMRNLALAMVTTRLVFMIDADFVPNPGLHEHLTQHEEKFEDLVKKTEYCLLVVPAFQLTEDKSIQYQHSLHVLPHTKEELREAWWNGIVDCFQCDVSPDSHQPSEYYKFTDPAVTWPYQVWYKEGFEPFYIASMNHLPKFDARFRGHGKNKVAHTYLLSIKDFEFWVIPEGFLVELPHPPSLSEKRKVQDPLQTWRIDGIYNRFINEVNRIYSITTASKGSEKENNEGTLC